ncbi:threonine-phosphate decarboxylase CobD [Undibacterium parvum]|uniref:threonine-phosphate decarboxylase n=1 Tax=Undibacterium parvum TaxID=401471 RepID=A0A3Q9BU32_9BURK|nr:threonine-phosphate decarboxylase CobD [Undibacterium parvum]AZP14237.1 threonine-phosphate decarboxylase [Undibacterium parvum]
MLQHGGNLQEAAQRFDRPLADWLDLSTGINPRFYPVPVLSAHAWHRLPEQMPQLCNAAQEFYGAPLMLAVAGSQAAIQALPRLRLHQTGVAQVVVSAPSYAEHAYQWRSQGHRVTELPYAALAAAVAAGTLDVLVLCNPNNPTGATIPAATLLSWAAQLAQRGAWLIVDEAFCDSAPDLSVAAASAQTGLIVLRSVGKFFGLAGLRLGFVGAEPALLEQLENMLGPWSVSGPAQEIAYAALTDSAWQRDTRSYLREQAERMRQLLLEHGFSSQGTDLFLWCSDASLQGQTEDLFLHLAQRGIWVRLFLQAARGLRFGLPSNQAEWLRLSLALQAWSTKTREIT